MVKAKSSRHSAALKYGMHVGRKDSGRERQSKNPVKLWLTMEKKGKLPFYWDEMTGRSLGAQVGAERTSGQTCLRVAEVPEVKAWTVSTKVYPWELGQNLATILPHSPKGDSPRLVIQHHGPVLI